MNIIHDTSAIGDSLRVLQGLFIKFIKTSCLVLGTIVAFLSIGSVSAGPNSVELLNDYSSKTSYAWAARVANENAVNGVRIDEEAMLIGVDDAYHKRKPVLTSDEASQYFNQQMTKIRSARREEFASIDKERKRTEAAFNKKMRTIIGVTKLENGAYSKVIKAANGPNPRYQDRVEISYSVKAFEGSWNNQGVEQTDVIFDVFRLAPAMSTALQNMSEGSTWRLYLAQSHTLPIATRRVQPKPLYQGYDGPVVIDIELSNIISDNAK